MPENNFFLTILQAIKSGQNPQQVLMNLLEKQMSNSPVGQNLLELAKANDSNGIEQVARNLCAQRGIDFDKEFASFKELLN